MCQQRKYRGRNCQGGNIAVLLCIHLIRENKWFIHLLGNGISLQRGGAMDHFYAVSVAVQQMHVLQVVVMLGTVVVVFFVCLLPHRIFSLWFIFTTEIEDAISTVSGVQA